MKMTIRGIDDVNRTLRMIAPREARNLMRSTVQTIATGVGKNAQQHVPMDDGDLYRSIKAKRERMPDRNTVRSTVRVNRRAFYWRFLEYGDGPDGVEHAFFFRALQNFRAEMDQIYLRVFVKKLQARLKRLSK